MTKPVLALAIAYVLLTVASAEANYTTFSDGSASSYETWEGDTGIFSGAAITELDYTESPAASVEAFLKTPSGGTLAYQGIFTADWYARADVGANLDESAADGDYPLDSEHRNGTQFLGYLQFIFSYVNYYTRYYYVNTVGSDAQYSAWFCGNACQQGSAFVPLSRFPGGQPTPYLQGSGSRIAIFGSGFCQIALRCARIRGRKHFSGVSLLVDGHSGSGGHGGAGPPVRQRVGLT